MTKARDLANASTALSAVDATELGYLDGVTSNIQTQFGNISGSKAQPTEPASPTDGMIWVDTDGAVTDAQYIAKSLLTTTGDTIYASGANTPARLGIGSSGQVLSVSGGVPAWATPASSFTKIASATFTNVADTGTTFDNVFSNTYNNYVIVMSDLYGNYGSDLRFRLRTAGPTTVSTAYYGARLQNSTLTTISNLAQFVPLVLNTEKGSCTLSFSRDGTPAQWSYYGFQRYGNNLVMGGGMNDTVGGNSANGFILSADAGNIYGFVAVYGLAD